MFDQLLERQLRLKNVMTEAEWYDIKDSLRYAWQQDSYFEELKMNEILTTRMNLASQADAFVGRYYSEAFVKRDILKQTDDDVVQIAQDNRVDPPEPAGRPGEDDTFDHEADEALRSNNSPAGKTDTNFSPADDDTNASSPKKTVDTK